MEIAQLLSSSPLAALFLFIPGGMIVGSFVNVVAHRLPIMLRRRWRIEYRLHAGLASELPAHSAERDANTNTESETFNLLWPGSHCPHCGHRLRAWELVPLFSYLLLRGKCANCRRPISPRYPLVELGCGLLGGLLVLVFGVEARTLALLPFVYALAALALIDLEHLLLPDDLTLPLLWLGLLLNACFPALLGVGAGDAVIGAAGGYLLFAAVHHGYRLLTGREGMAPGDFKLLAAMGAWLGWMALPFIVFLSSISGALWGLGLILLRGRAWSKPLPFGPFLVFAGIATLLLGPEQMAAWLG